MQNNLALQVPHLTTALLGPLQKIEKHLLNLQVDIECWFRQQWRKTPPPVYASVDLRNAGFKISPVDTNLFPAGFNNLNMDFLPLCIQAAQSTLENIYPGCKRVLIVPENHTHNMFYFESLAVLQAIFNMAGFLVKIGSMREDVEKKTKINLPSGREIELEPLIRVNDRLGVKDFDACIVILNNDLSSGVPAILENISQPVLPPFSLGWITRLKSQHFAYYADVVKEFADLIKMDPWLLAPFYRQCNHVNFMQREGEDMLMEKTDELLREISAKYAEYNIKEKPYVIIKADAGTYGMGVLPIFSSDEIPKLNRKKRKDMSVTKGGRPITQVLLQEGVYTFETWKEATAEPVVYMMGQYVIGGFYRVHTGRGMTDNLNSPGMHFAPLAFVEVCNKPQSDETPDYCANRFYSYGVIARLALVAAAREQQNNR